MSETIDRMLAEARTRARAKAVPWGHLTRETIGELHRQALRDAGLPELPKLLEILGRVYTWDGYVSLYLHVGKDPLPAMVRDLRKIRSPERRISKSSVDVWVLGRQLRSYMTS